MQIDSLELVMSEIVQKQPKFVYVVYLKSDFILVKFVTTPLLQLDGAYLVGLSAIPEGYDFIYVHHEDISGDSPYKRIYVNYWEAYACLLKEKKRRGQLR